MSTPKNIAIKTTLSITPAIFTGAIPCFAISCLTLLEAMLAGIPCIASSVGGIPEVLDYGRCGKLVQPNNSQQLCSAITTLCIGRDDAKMLGLLGQERALACFLVADMAQGYFSIYRRLLEEDR